MAFTIIGVDPSQNESLREIEHKTGPSNFFRIMAHRPEAMRDAAKFYFSVMGPGSIDRRTKEMIYLAVSSVNECDYCGSHHEVAAREAGLSEQEIEDIRAETDVRFSARERAALHYARELTRTAAAENDTRSMLETLFSPEQQVELTLVISLANFTNRFNNGLSVPREKAEKHHVAS
ncbi:MAG TPA: carboxymuconolactone decarboxylase family protein [Bryobacteraceae bacterium]|jgi:uncharacterized peroxidase-related enzyme|nr:carboxymuconolactone decarboxylase family protein [Bryobacteraceae bacterium]